MKEEKFLRLFETLYDIHPLDDFESWYTDSVQDRWNKQVVSASEGMSLTGVKYAMDCYWKLNLVLILQ